jgi:hypothetical protein
MFLDDELNEIFEQKGFEKETSLELIKACMKRIDFDNGWDALCNSLKRTDFSWHLFCKKHRLYDEDGFRKVYLHSLGDDEEGLRLQENVKKALNW